MKTALIAAGAVVGFFVLIALWGMGLYNGFVSKQEAVSPAFDATRPDGPAPSPRFFSGERESKRRAYNGSANERQISG